MTRITIRLLPAATILLALTLPAMAGAGFFSWSNPAGGMWNQTANWDPAGYPQYYWDFANFDLDGIYEVDATDPARIAAIAGLSVRAGEVRLRTHGDLRVVAVVGGAGVPASLDLLLGAINGTGTHRVAADGRLHLAEGTAIAGSPSFGPGLVIEPGGRLYAGGSVLGNGVQNMGSASPGHAAGGTGFMDVAVSGAWTQFPEAALVMDLAGAEAGVSHDQLRVSAGQLVLDGTLRVVLAPGYLPGAGDEFILLRSAVLDGDFHTVELPEAPGLAFSLVRESDHVLLRVDGEAMAEAQLDALPGSCRNPVSTKRRGVIPMALLGSASLDVSTVAVSEMRVNGLVPVKWHLEDISAPRDGDTCDACPGAPDGIPDLVLHVAAAALRDTWGDPGRGDEVMVTFEGMTVDGAVLVAEDCMSMVGGGKKKSAAAGIASGFGMRPASAPQDSRQRILVSVPRAAHAHIDVYDVTGRRIVRLGPLALAAGDHEVSWDASGLSRGVYFYRMVTDEAVLTAKQVLLP